MSRFYLPLTALHPVFEGPRVEAPPFTLAKRRWDVSTFDLATLQSRHRLHMPYEAMSVMLSDVHSELALSGEISHLEAADLGRSFRAALYGLGLSPSVIPYVASHSINDYAGINARDTPFPMPGMHPELREGITSETATIEVWPLELYMAAWRLFHRVDLTEAHVVDASARAIRWVEMASKQKPLAALERALVAAPLIAPIAQSFLHLWSAVEAMFPSVNTEVVFRLALYIAQLVEGPRKGDRRAYARRVRKAYDLRSRVAHGSRTDIELDSWIDSWDITCDVYNAVQVRGRLPSEDELEDEALE